jgi:hypothetical protein
MGLNGFVLLKSTCCETKLLVTWLSTCYSGYTTYETDPVAWLIDGALFSVISTSPFGREPSLFSSSSWDPPDGASYGFRVIINSDFVAAGF